MKRKIIFVSLFLIMAFALCGLAFVSQDNSVYAAEVSADGATITLDVELYTFENGNVTEYNSGVDLSSVKVTFEKRSDNLYYLSYNSTLFTSQSVVYNALVRATQNDMLRLVHFDLINGNDRVGYDSEKGYTLAELQNQIFGLRLVAYPANTGNDGFFLEDSWGDTVPFINVLYRFGNDVIFRVPYLPYYVSTDMVYVMPSASYGNVLTKGIVDYFALSLPVETYVLNCEAGVFSDDAIFVSNLALGSPGMRAVSLLVTISDQSFYTQFRLPDNPLWETLPNYTDFTYYDGTFTFGDGFSNVEQFTIPQFDGYQLKGYLIQQFTGFPFVTTLLKEFTVTDYEDFESWQNNLIIGVDGSGIGITPLYEQRVYTVTFEYIDKAVYDSSGNITSYTWTSSSVQVDFNDAVPSGSYLYPVSVAEKFFAYWTVEGSTEIIEPEDILLRSVTADITYTAYYVNEIFNVTFWLNFERMGTAAYASYQGSIDPPDFTFPVGVTLQGWSLELNGAIADLSTYVLTDDIDLYAITNFSSSAGGDIEIPYNDCLWYDIPCHLGNAFDYFLNDFPIVSDIVKLIVPVGNLMTLFSENMLLLDGLGWLFTISLGIFFVYFVFRLFR